MVFLTGFLKRQIEISGYLLLKKYQRMNLEKNQRIKMIRMQLNFQNGIQ